MGNLKKLYNTLRKMERAILDGNLDLVATLNKDTFEPQFNKSFKIWDYENGSPEHLYTASRDCYINASLIDEYSEDQRAQFLSKANQERERILEKFRK